MTVAGISVEGAGGSARPAVATGTPVLVATGVGKSFFGVPVLRDVDITLKAGQVHGLVGENGAGKSTLMKIIAGVYRRDEGSVRLDGAEVDYEHPVQAARDGIATVFQEFTLLPERSVAENVFLGREPRRGLIVGRGEMARRTAALLDELGVEGIAPDARVGSLTVAEQQLVEVAKALAVDARVISMDEPTAALADHEVELLYAVIRRLTARGVAVLYVSHRLREIFDLCDEITILKDGALVSSTPAKDLTPDELVRRMVGRPITTFYPAPLDGTVVGEPLLELEGAGNGYVDGIDLQLRAGEVTGIAGLQGSGRTELAEAIFGIVPFSRGRMRVAGAERSIRRPRAAIRAGLALITEDRKSQGLALRQSILDNMLLVIRSVFGSRTGAVRRAAPGLAFELEVNTKDLNREVQLLSGGNQQKVVLAKWLSANPRVILLDEPTRGIDVGAKIAVYDVIRRLAKEGAAVLMISSELPELLGVADRIVVMRDGRIAGELPPTASEEDVLAVAAGRDEEAGR